MSAEIKLEIEYPEGYELAESKPRQVDNGEYYMGHGFSLFHWTQRKSSAAKYIILKKKAPEYYVTDLMVCGETTKMVALKALEDALDLVDQDELSSFDEDTFKELAELIE